MGAGHQLPQSDLLPWTQLVCASTYPSANRHKDLCPSPTAVGTLATLGTCVHLAPSQARLCTASLKRTSLSLMFTLPLFSHSVTPWTVARQAPLSFTTSQSLLKLMPTESVMLSNHLILFYPLFHLSSIFPSIRVFSNESALHIMWPKYWNFSFSTGSSDGYSGLISFRINWLEGKRRTFWGVGHTMGHSRS